MEEMIPEMEDSSLDSALSRLLGQTEESGNVGRNIHICGAWRSLTL